jgi:hypothetical protein
LTSNYIGHTIWPEQFLALERQVMNVMWTNTAFGMYMGQHEAITTAAFEPARRRGELLGQLADTQCATETSARTVGRFGFAATALHTLTGGRRLARG